VVQDLWHAGWRVSVNTVAAVMADHGWAGRQRPRRRSLTRQGKHPAAPDLVGRDFTADAPDRGVPPLGAAGQGECGAATSP
jgi:hypothetical protein